MEIDLIFDLKEFACYFIKLQAAMKTVSMVIPQYQTI